MPLSLHIDQHNDALHLVNLEKKYLPGEKWYQSSISPIGNTEMLLENTERQVFLTHTLALLGLTPGQSFLHENQKDAFRLFSQMAGSLSYESLQLLNTKITEPGFIASIQSSNIDPSLA